MKTRAAIFLTKRNISFETVEYEHEEKGVEFASKAMGFPLEKTIKTLVTDLGPDGYALALVPGGSRLSVKKLAKACSAKRAAMADTETAQRLTGYRVGGISPFGTARKLPAVMEQSLLRYDKVAVNGGQRGVMLIMNPKDILKASGGKAADLIV